MDTTSVVKDRWSELVTLLPRDINETALQMEAIKRRRQIRDGRALLRLALAYAFACGSLRETAAWAAANRLAYMSDVAVLKRLRAASAWLSFVLMQMLSERTKMVAPRLGSLRVRVVDATSISRRGSAGTDWRIHLGFDLGAFRIDHLEVTDAHGGETFTRHTVREGDVLLADRGYSHRRGIWSVVCAGGDVIVRVQWRGLPLREAQGNDLDILAAARRLETGDIADIPAQIAADEKAGIPTIVGRLVILRKSEEVTQRARKSILSNASKKGHKTDPRTLEAAAYVFVFTTVSPDRLSASEVMELYRFRWQIELAFKRLKSITDLDEMAAQDPDLCRTYLCSKLIGALLIEDLTQAVEAFSPWGYGTPIELTLAGVPDGL